MRKVREILRLRWSEHLSLRDVASAAAMPHATVALYEKRALEAGLSWPLPDLDDDALEAMLFTPTPEKVTREQPDFAYLQRELRHKGVTLQLLFDEYRESHPDGYGYSQFCKLYAAWKRHLDVVMRQDHLAGEKLFVDFSGLTIPIYDEATLALSFRAELFVAVLGASNYFFCEALRSQELEHWVNAHAHCFAFLGGVPSIVVCDNLKSGLSLRAGPQRHVPRDGRALRHRHHPRTSLQAPRQGQGRSGGADRRALDYGRLAQGTLHEFG
jgi:transposase